MYTYICIYTHTHTHTHTFISMNPTHVYTYVNTLPFTVTYIHTSKCIYPNIHTVFKNRCIYKYMQTYISN